MSHLHRPGLTFWGRFEADVATGNNSPRFYTDPPTTPPPADTNWNLPGGGEFRLLDCVVGAVLDDGADDADGADGADGADDPVRTAVVTDARDRVAGKIVDLDPQYQGASQLFGLRVRIVADGVELIAGEFVPAGFRDYARWHARFVSVLDDIVWAPPGTSGFVDRLRETTADGLLAIRLITHSYNTGTRIGRLDGAIGPYRSGEPHQFVAGRHFLAPPDDTPLNSFDGVVDGDRLTIDLANSLALDGPQTGLTDEFRIGLLTSSITAAGAVVEEGRDVVTLSRPVPYQEPGWLRTTGGLVTVDLPDSVTTPDGGTRPIDHRPLALVRGSAPRRVAIRETPAGLLVRADDEVVRLEPGHPATTRIRVTRYGVPVAGAQLVGGVRDPVPAMGGPLINTPREWLRLHSVPPTDGDGWTSLRLEGDQRGGPLPRPRLDGQLYEVTVASHGAEVPLDLLVVHLYQEYDLPDLPTWEGHVRRLLEPYAVMYPVMKRVFDLSDQAAVRRRREILRFALTRDVTDPNYMPVTRDLSRRKRETILAWLASSDLPEGQRPDHDRDDRHDDREAPGPPAAEPVLLDDVPGAFVGKVLAARRRAEVLGREEP
jgi:hypothetical protein